MLFWALTARKYANIHTCSLHAKLRTYHSDYVSEITYEHDVIWIPYSGNVAVPCSNQLTVFPVQYLLHLESVPAEVVGFHDELAAWEYVAGAVKNFEPYQFHGYTKLNEKIIQELPPNWIICFLEVYKQLMHCFSAFPFLLKYLMNAEYIISNWQVMSKSTFTIPNNFLCIWS